MGKNWDFLTIKKEALKYNTRIEFQKKSSKAYDAAHYHSWLDEICQHMKKSANESMAETELFNIIKNQYPKTQKLRDRKVSIPDKPYIKRFEIDIYIPELRKGIEFDGSYWHGEGFSRTWTDCPNTYHKIKDEYFNNKGIKI